MFILIVGVEVKQQTLRHLDGRQMDFEKELRLQFVSEWSIS